LYLSVGGNTVGDTIQVTDNTALQGTVSVVSNTAGGNLEFGNNSTTNGLGVDRNVVGGHLKVHNNTATDLDASLDVSGNAVTKSLNCRNDNPAAVALYGLNTAAKKLGECAGL
jgi:hypothetical protein